VLSGLVRNERQNITETIKDMPLFEYRPQELYDAKRHETLIPNRGRAFLSLTDELELVLDKNYKEWALRSTIMDGLTSAKISTEVGAIFYADPETRQILEELSADHNLTLTLSNLFRTSGSIHTARLLTHENAPACEAFAQSVILNIHTLGGDIWEHIPRSIDGNAAEQFWTLGPYIYANLYFEEGLTDEQAFDAVIRWSTAREQYQTKGYGSNQQAHYPGIRFESESFRLAKDGVHESHVFANKIGEHIAIQLKQYYV
jgi:hypothetical protein